MEALIIHSLTLFDDQSSMASYASSPPLPPAPLGEIPPSFAYGSTHTKFSEYGSQQQIPITVPPLQTPTPQISTGDDFTPQLPPRPPASIHPSSRGNSGGSTNGLSNTSPTRSEAEAIVPSPTSLTPALPLPLRPGKQGGLTPIHGLKGTQGLDFSQQEVAEGDSTEPALASLPSGDPPTPPSSALKSLQVLPPPPPSALHQSNFAQQQQPRPASAQTQTQEKPQPRAQPPPPLPGIERTAVGDFESISSPPENSLSSTVDDGHSTDYGSPITPDAPTGPTLQPAASQPPIQQKPRVPIKANQAQEQSQQSPAYSLRQLNEIPPEPQDLPTSQLQ